MTWRTLRSHGHEMTNTERTVGPGYFHIRGRLRNSWSVVNFNAICCLMEIVHVVEEFGMWLEGREAEGGSVAEISGRLAENWRAGLPSWVLLWTVNGQISMLSQILSARWKPCRTSSPFHIPPFKNKFLLWFLKWTPGPVAALASVPIIVGFLDFVRICTLPGAT